MQDLTEMIKTDILVVLFLSEIETLFALVFKHDLLCLGVAMLFSVLLVKFDILLLDVFILSLKLLYANSLQGYLVFELFQMLFQVF